MSPLEGGIVCQVTLLATKGCVRASTRRTGASKLRGCKMGRACNAKPHQGSACMHSAPLPSSHARGAAAAGRTSCSCACSRATSRPERGSACCCCSRSCRAVGAGRAMGPARRRARPRARRRGMHRARLRGTAGWGWGRSRAPRPARGARPGRQRRPRRRRLPGLRRLRPRPTAGRARAWPTPARAPTARRATPPRHLAASGPASGPGSLW